MKSKTKKVYETPQLTVVSFKMERGYASSDGVEEVFYLGLYSESENSSRSRESRSIVTDYWGGGDEDSWF